MYQTKVYWYSTGILSCSMNQYVRVNVFVEAEFLSIECTFIKRHEFNLPYNICSKLFVILTHTIAYLILKILKHSVVNSM